MAGDSHPLHPATVHFPLTLLLLSYALDVVQILPFLRSFPILGSSLKDIDVPKTSYYLLSLGLIASTLAIVTGGQQLMVMIQRQDLLNKLSKADSKLAVLRNMHVRLKMAFVHALSNDIVAVASMYIWWAKRNARGYDAGATMAGLSTVLAIIQMGSAALGGKLIYEHGVGVVAMGRKNRDEKEQ